MSQLRASTVLPLLSLVLLHAVVSVSAYPSWLVLVTVKCDGQATDRCLGAVVASDHVVTAARCFSSCALQDATVRVYTGLGKSARGTLTLGDRMKRTEVTIHPSYNSASNMHDIALIKIDCLSSNTAIIQPVDDCSLFRREKEYTTCDLLNRKTLFEYNVTRSGKKSCSKEYGSAFTASQMLCFKKSQCSDNTVGLTFRDNKLVALSTVGLECPSDEQQSYDSFGSLDICRYSAWINDQISAGDDKCGEAVGTTTTPTKATTTAPQTDDVTSPTPAASIISCPKLTNPSHGSINFILNVAFFSCDANYRRKGARVSHCILGAWTKKPPTCQPITCPPLEDIPNGQVQLTGNTVGSAARYSCSADYTIEGYVQRRCNNKGVWDGEPPTCHVTKKIFCKHPGGIQCGSTSQTGALTSGSTLTFTPNSNSELIGPTTITCINGEWSGPVPQCRVLCPMNFDIANGRYHLDKSDNAPDYKMKFTCNAGFSGSFYDEYTCSNGLWSPSPRDAKCVATCPTLNIKNAKVELIDLVVIKYAIVTCFNNYRLQGSPLLTCEHGVWQEQISSCKPS